MAFKLAYVCQVVALVIFAACVCSEAKSDRPKFLVPGRCPIVKIPTGFDTSNFAGKWYRIGGLRNAEEKSVNCTVYNYQPSGAGYTVLSNGVKPDFSPVTQSSSLSQQSSGLAQFSTTIRGEFEAEMVVVNTDYTSYACIFTCYNFQESHKAQFAWILSRSPTLDKSKIAACQRSLRNVGVTIADLRGTYQGASCNH